MAAILPRVQRPVDTRDTGDLRIHSIFATLQGEGPFAGTPAVFVRLFGCNLACFYCDTDYESQNTLMMPEAIYSAVREAAPLNASDPYEKRRLVVITGGEPFRQNIMPTIRMLLEARYIVQIETAGTIWPPLSDHDSDVALRYIESGALTIVCSPKTKRVALGIERYCRDWKYIIGHDDWFDELTGLPCGPSQDKSVEDGAVRATHIYHAHNFPGNTIWLQPRDDGPGKEEDSARNMQLAVALCAQYNHRLSIQTHKVIGLP